VSRIKVMVVDDSAVVRQVVAGLLADDPDIEVIAAVADPILAIARMKVHWPDVFVLDIEMPRMDGITFLKRIMVERPTPVVICSTLTEKGAQTSMPFFMATPLCRNRSVTAVVVDDPEFTTAFCFSQFRQHLRAAKVLRRSLSWVLAGVKLVELFA